MSEGFKFCAVFLLVLANGFFVATEFALVTMRTSRISIMAATGDRRAIRLLGISGNLNTYISAIQLGVTLASLAIGWIGEPTVARLIERPLSVVGASSTLRHTLAFVLAFSAITFVQLVLGELVPKTLALERTEAVALATSWPIEKFYKIFYWPIRALYAAGVFVVRLLGMKASFERTSIYTEDELRQIIDLSHKSGHLEAGERQLINRILDFTDAEVREAMVPRTAIAALPITATLPEVREAFCTSGYSRIPVHRGKLDDIAGVVFMKELLPCFGENQLSGFEIENLLHPPLFVPATARLGPVLQQMQSSRTHLAFVVDEHGGIEGIVTIEDLLEEIVGEINDEYDEEALSDIAEEDGSYVMDGMLGVREVNRYFGLDLPEDSSYRTLAGFLLARAGRILHSGESIEYDGARFTVERVERHRIRRIRYTRVAKEKTAAAG